MHSFSQQVVIGMDVAASEFYDNKDKTYDLNFKEEVIHTLYILYVYVYKSHSIFPTQIRLILNNYFVCCRKMTDHKKYLATA
jgi:enolase